MSERVHWSVRRPLPPFPAALVMNNVCRVKQGVFKPLLRHKGCFFFFLVIIFFFFLVVAEKALAFPVGLETVNQIFVLLQT